MKIHLFFTCVMFYCWVFLSVDFTEHMSFLSDHSFYPCKIIHTDRGYNLTKDYILLICGDKIEKDIYNPFVLVKHNTSVFASCKSCNNIDCVDKFLHRIHIKYHMKNYIKAAGTNYVPLGRILFNIIGIGIIILSINLLILFEVQVIGFNLYILYQITIYRKKICSICLETECNTILSFCRHSFHDECISTWYKKSDKCPNCRNTFFLWNKIHV